MGVAVAETDEGWEAPVSDASPVWPVGERDVEGVLFIVSPSPWFGGEPFESCRSRVFGVASGFFFGDGFGRGWGAGWLDLFRWAASEERKC